MIATITAFAEEKVQRSNENLAPAITAIAATAKVPGCIAYAHAFQDDANTNIEKAIDLALSIEEVQRYDCLYNKFSKEYRDKCTKINCWNAVGQKFKFKSRTQVLCLSRSLLRRKTPIIKAGFH